MITAPDAPIDCLITLTPINIVQAAADLVWSPVLRKFPDLKVALSEGGIGWIPYFLERMDCNYDRHHAWTGQDFGDELPSEVFNEHVLTCFIDDPFGVASREFLDMDNVMWECDYPHSDSTWPTAPGDARPEPRAGSPDDDIDQITHLNAMRHFRYDPFLRWAARSSARSGPCGNGRWVTTSQSGRGHRPASKRGGPGRLTCSLSPHRPDGGPPLGAAGNPP